MSNCHPTILLKLTRDLGLPNIYLSMYVNNRKEFLDENDTSKQDVLRLLNQDKPKKQKGAIQNLVTEILKNKKKIIEAHKSILNSNRKKNIKNPLSSSISNILCYYENQLLKRVIDAKIPMSIPMYDGFIAPPNANIEIETLNKLTEDFKIVWTNKSLDTPFELQEFEEKDSYKLMKENQHLKAMCLVISLNNGSKIKSVKIMKDVVLNRMDEIVIIILLFSICFGVGQIPKQIQWGISRIGL